MGTKNSLSGHIYCSLCMKMNIITLNNILYVKILERGSRNMKLKKYQKEIREFCILDCSKCMEELLRVVLLYIEYYHVKSNIYKYAYRSSSVIKYLALAAIPVIQVMPSARDFPWIVAVLSSVSITLDSVINLFQMKDKWIIYRKTDCRLLREQRLYKLHAGEYYGLEKEERQQKFVMNFEEIVGEESREWSEIVIKPEAPGSK